MLNEIEVVTDEQRRAILRKLRSGVAKDGEVVRLPLMLMDGQSRAAPAPKYQTNLQRPGFATLPPQQIAAKELMQGMRDAVLRDAWRDPPTPFSPDNDVAAQAAAVVDQVERHRSPAAPVSLPGNRPADGTTPEHRAYQARLERAYLNPSEVW